MIKRTWSVIVALVAALAFPAVALAANDWQVTYTSAGEMEENFANPDERTGMQPGDTEEFVINLKQDYKDEARWYMSNKVTKTLEDKSGSGSAYSYKLEFDGPSGHQTLFDSDKVGGQSEGQVKRDGLKDATDGLDEWMYLDNFTQGATGTVTLSVTMDGDTEANEYFDTEALVNMEFAVELDPEPENTERVVRREIPRRRIVRTGDETNLMPFYIAMAVSGALLVALGVYGMVERKKEAVR